MNKFVFTKRKKIIFISLIICGVTFILELLKIPLIGKFFIGAVATYLLTLWVFDFMLKGMEYIVLPLMPILFYLSMILAYPILERLDLHYLIYLALIGGMYILLLTFNILDITMDRPIPLSRAAWISLSLSRFIISFLVYTFLFWFHFDWYIIIFLIFIFTLFLTYPGFYLLIHELGRGERSFFYIIPSTLYVVEVGFLLSFWRIPFYGAGLILAATLYIITGILEAHLKARLSRGFFWEYGVVALFAIFLLFFL